jgi:DNA-binding beta-propeller fold protein YncE/mono/diheme cytochrome c family protein
MRWIFSALLTIALATAVWTGRGAAQSDRSTLEKENQALKQQLAAMAPTQVVQAGQLAPPPPVAQPTGWDTEESLRGHLRLLATYDSSGPDAWDVAAHPLVYFTSEGVGSNPRGGTPKTGVQIIDAYSKKVIASALFDLGEEVTQNPHGVGISPDGRWVYLGQMHRVAATGETRTVLLIVNARTLKLDRTLLGPRVDWFHHITAFKDWQGRDRVLVAFGRTPGGGPHWLLDPHDKNRVVRAITIEDIGYKIGHPYPTLDPTRRIVFVSVFAPPWRERSKDTGGIAKLNLVTGEVAIIPFVGENPIGMAHTSDGRFTYVNDSESSNVFKIDNETNTVVGHTSAGVTGPYGLVLNWDETMLYAIGKGEGGHNRGSVVGMVEARTMRPARTLHNMPIWLGGSASSIDHGILHPDPKVNELWISNMNGWETIVLDLDTHKVTDYIATPNGGDTHSGGFVRYKPDWTGELLADMGGPKGPMLETMRARAAGVKQDAPARTAAAAPATANPVTLGRTIFEETAGGVGCASCHGMDGAGNNAMGGPDIRGATEDRVRPALAGVEAMSTIKLTDAEIAAVVAHLQRLNKQP